MAICSSSDKVEHGNIEIMAIGSRKSHRPCISNTACISYIRAVETRRIRNRSAALHGGAILPGTLRMTTHLVGGCSPAQVGFDEAGRTHMVKINHRQKT